MSRSLAPRAGRAELVELIATYVVAIAVAVMAGWLLAPALRQVSTGFNEGVCEGRGDVWSTSTHTCSPGRRTYEQGVCEGRGGVYDLPAATCRPVGR